jgi:hypothetical protein
MQNQHFRYKLKNLNLQKSELVHMFGNQDDEILDQSVWEGLNTELAYANQIQGGYSIYEGLAFDKKKKSITIGNIPFYVGPVLFPRFKNVEKIAVIICTAGAILEELTKQHFDKDETLIGYSLDAFGTLITDKVLQNVTQQLRESMLSLGFSITGCYCPGYCDWSLYEQEKLFSLLPDRFCGVTLNDSCLMSPLKSLSGLIGIGHDVKEDFPQCRICNMGNCYMRKEAYFTQIENE